MSKKRHASPERHMKPMVLVFCEGATETEYVSFLRTKFRASIKIVSHVTGQKLSQKMINRYIKLEKLNMKDTIHTFLMYDLDSLGIAEKVKECRGEMICCNPCIELWFLLHEKEQYAYVSTTSCFHALKKIAGWENYKRGSGQTGKGLGRLSESFGSYFQVNRIT